MRSPFRVDVERDRGALARVVDDGWVENVYRLQVMNATETEQHYRIRVEGLPGSVLDGPADVAVGGAQTRWVPLAVRVPPAQADAAGPGAHRIDFIVERVPADATTPSRSLHERSTFLVPR
jgi:polyferredoxin